MKRHVGSLHEACPCIVYVDMGAGTAFWSALPPGTFWPMFVVATAAAIIASQALISAVFQIVSQAIAQGFFPRFKIYHTSRKVVPGLLTSHA